jgi:hypothetical protein
MAQTESGVHQASYPVGSEGKTAEVRSWPLISNQYRGQENADLYIHSVIRLHG